MPWPAGSNWRCGPLQEKDLSVHEMDRVVHDLFQKEYGEKLTGAVYLLERQIRKHLQDLLKKYYLQLVRNRSITVLDNERELSDIQIGSFHLRGRLDSIELRDGKTCIIDYKTSSNPDRLRIDFDKLDADDRRTWSEAIGSLQLPFYLMLYAEKTHVKMADLEGMFLLLGLSLINTDIELPLFAGPFGENTHQMLKAIIMKLLSEIVDQGVPFTSTPHKKEMCPYCDFRFLCGTQWIVK